MSEDGFLIRRLHAGHSLGRQKPEQQSRVRNQSVGCRNCHRAEGLPRDFALCYQILFSSDSGNLITAESGRADRTTVPSWKLDRQRKRITRSESISRDQLVARLSPRPPASHRAPRSFQLTDALAVVNFDECLTAVTLETGEITLYSSVSGYCPAVCRVIDKEVVVVPRTNLVTPCTQAEIDRIERAARARLQAAPAQEQSASRWQSSLRTSRKMRPRGRHGTIARRRVRQNARDRRRHRSSHRISDRREYPSFHAIPILSAR